MIPAEGDATVIGALHSADAIRTAVSALGRAVICVSGKADFHDAVDRTRTRAVLFEPGHPAFGELCTRLSAAALRSAVIVLLPAGWIPANELMDLSRLVAFSMAYDRSELAKVFRRTMGSGPASDAFQIAEALCSRLPQTPATLALGLYVAGARNVSVSEAASRLGSLGLRNRLRTLGMARASTILGWASALAVVWRLENHHCSLAEASRAVGFETARQCSDRVLYHTRRTPTALHRRYGFAGLAEEFLEVVAARESRWNAVQFLGDDAAPFSYRAAPRSAHYGASHSWRNSWSYESGR